jgi:hypothetical protein
LPCAVLQRANEPGNSCGFLEHRHARTLMLRYGSPPRSGGCIVAVFTASSPALGGIPRLSSSIASPLPQNAAFVPHHSRRLSAPHPFPSAPLHFWAAHLEFVYRLSEALGTPRPRGAYSPTSGVSTGRALMSARHCRPCHPPVYHRIPRTENEHAHSIDTYHTFCCYDQEGADLSDGRGQFRILLLALD